jgi:uncharacterized membrane protein YkvA (DUF1232 family)
MRRLLNINKYRYWKPKSLARLVSITNAALDPRAPLPAKIVAWGTVAYALSPIDLIPDFIPVIGWVDDAAIVTLGLWATSKLMPQGLLEEHYERYMRGREKTLS